MLPIRVPRIRKSAVPKISTIVTSTPSWRSEAATSAPMNPIPTTTALLAPRARSRIASASAIRRSCSTPSRSAPGTSSTRFRTPVATRAASNGMLPPSRKVTAPARGSIRWTIVSRRTSISWSSHHPSGRTNSSSAGSSPRRYALDNPGRSYGACGSSPIMIRRPSNPDRRSVAAAVAPVSEAPTITKVRSATEGSGLDLDLTVLFADGVGLDRLGGRTLDDLTRLHREHASVAFALDRRSVNLAAHRQVAVAVRADIAERVQGRPRTRHRDLGALHLERLRRAFLDIARRGDRDELRHRSPLGRGLPKPTRDRPAAVLLRDRAVPPLRRTPGEPRAAGPARATRRSPPAPRRRRSARPSLRGTRSAAGPARTLRSPMRPGRGPRTGRTRDRVLLLARTVASGSRTPGARTPRLPPPW